MSENNASARASDVLAHFVAVLCKTTTSNYKIIGFAENVNTRSYFSFLYLNLKAIPTNSAPGQSTHIRQIKQIGQNCKVVSMARIFFSRCAFLGVVVVIA